MRTPYYGSRSEHPLDDSPLDLAPRRLIAPRRRLREFVVENFRTPDSLPNNELSEDSINRIILGESMANQQQPESPAVTIYYNFFFQNIIF